MQIKPPSRTYRRFFIATKDARHVFLQGGRRSGKTFATFQWLALTCPGEQVLVATAKFDQLKNTIRDFEDVTGVQVTGSKKESYMADLWDTHFVFNHYDDRGKAQGTKCDRLFINEAVEMAEEVLTTLLLGVRRQVIYNYNPTAGFPALETYGREDNVLTTTWRDNPYLTEEQREEFEQLRIKAESPYASPFDIYNYKVFYLGDFSELSGAVFGQLHTCSVEDYKQCPAEEWYGMDFGFAALGDPTAVVGCKVTHDKKLLLRQYAYVQGWTTDDIDTFLTRSGIGGRYVAADWGGDGRQRMDDLIMRGHNLVDAIKGSVKGGLEKMRSYSIHVCEDSTDLRKELDGIRYDAGRLVCKNGDHATDAARYALSLAEAMTY